jgi:hypothetical protein
MNENKFAELNTEQIKEVHQLEEKLQVILLAYDHIQGNISEENDPIIINPS